MTFGRNPKTLHLPLAPCAVLSSQRLSILCTSGWMDSSLASVQCPTWQSVGVKVPFVTSTKSFSPHQVFPEEFHLPLLPQTKTYTSPVAISIANPKDRGGLWHSPHPHPTFLLVCSCSGLLTAALYCSPPWPSAKCRPSPPTVECDPCYLMFWKLI